MARSDRIYAVVWTWRHHRLVKTKKRGAIVLRVWKRWYERGGWEVHSSGPDAYVATHPGTGERHAIAFHEYDSVTHERLWAPPRRTTAKPRETSDVPRRRAGRKPAYA